MHNQLAINTLRTLSMDAVQKANSGHPGTPMALAPLSHLLWTRFIRFNPKNPTWCDRDRFVLSCGHASMLIYAQLHLAGFNLSLEELKNFRQWGSQTPGHPEYGHTPGVETTTGPLGQGFGNAVGMAMAEKHLAAYFNRPDHTIVDHYTYVIASDGDLMEGVAAEAASLAGHFGLGKLIVSYDDNKITIDGSTDITFSEDVEKRFEAYGWQVQHVDDANDLKRLEKATRNAHAETEKPSLIIIRSHIAYGSPNKQDTAAAHGAPLGEEEVHLTKEAYGWPTDKLFYVPEAVRELYAERAEKGCEEEKRWEKRFSEYRKTYPELAAEFERRLAGTLPQGWNDAWPTFEAKGGLATRQSSHQAMQKVAATFPEFLGGSADLACSNLTTLNGEKEFSHGTPEGRNIPYGIREHGMAAVTNGLALHGSLLPFAATFLIFSDYMRPSIRLAAMMKIPTRYVFTHDSIGLGEDGPTHQPVEQLMSLRAIPGLTVIRPADANETIGAWKIAASHREGPIALSLTRQKVPTLEETDAVKVEKGAYVLAEAKGGVPALILIATGSEVALARDAWKHLTDEGVAVRLVSMPSWELFYAQSKNYQDEVLPSQIIRRVSIEAGTTFGWERIVGSEGSSVGIDRFGASAPAEVSFGKFGFTVDTIVSHAKSLLAQ